jgi:polyhydroxyalkanoic acid synthase PhaR subunit
MTKTKEATQDTDVFGVWRQLYDENEKAWSAALEQAMGSSEFGESSGRLLETMLAAQKSVRDNMRVYLETMNVPTREDIARLGELVVGLEEKVDQIGDRLDTIDGTLRGRSADTAKIDRIATRIDAIDGTLRSRSADTAKIDQIAKRLDTIERATRRRPADTAKIDRIAKRLDTIDRAVRGPSAQRAKPAAPATPAATARTARTAKTATTAIRTAGKPAAKQARPVTTAKPAAAAASNAE